MNCERYIILSHFLQSFDVEPILSTSLIYISAHTESFLSFGMKITKRGEIAGEIRKVKGTYTLHSFILFKAINVFTYC